LPEVLVVHCVDAEGPLGGDARRNQDGTAEFLDSWPRILRSLCDLTRRRYDLTDSHGGPWRFNWFTLDFTGFKTNPKCRDTTPLAVYDRLRKLDTRRDGFYFHHHAVPKCGSGDVWADGWHPGEAERQLARLLTQRQHIPLAFRAGGTIETNELSRWLEGRFALDFSNRVSERSYPDAPLTEFNWYGAPKRWGFYHPHQNNFLAEGHMRRFVYRCIDLRSRYNELTADHVDEAFTQALVEERPAVLSFFSHDNRDMRDETVHAHRLLVEGSERHGMPWRSCTAIEAHRRHLRG
jgi:hypothetical protein